MYANHRHSVKLRVLLRILTAAAVLQSMHAHNSDYMICNLQDALYEASVWGVVVGLGSRAWGGCLW